jgi:hypothetical protein
MERVYVLRVVVCALLCVSLPVVTAWIVLAVNVLSGSGNRRR